MQSTSLDRDDNTPGGLRGKKHHKTARTGLIFSAVLYIDGLMQKKRNSIVNTLELRLFCIKPSTIKRLIYEAPK